MYMYMYITQNDVFSIAGKIIAQNDVVAQNLND